MELRQLEYFLMVSETGSFTRAAERLYVSQPAITNAIRNLETELGVLLFDRGQKQALLTAEGRVFFRHVEHVMNGVSQTISEINQMKNLSSGQLVLGVTPFAGIAASVELLESFHQTYPQIHIKVMEDNSLAIQQALIEDKIELGLTIESDKNPFIDVLPLSEEPVVVCCSRAHRLASLNIVSLAELVNEPLLLYPEPCFLRKKIIAAFEATNTLPQIKLEFAHIQTLKNFVAQNAGISLLPASLAAHDDRIAILPLAAPFAATQFIIWKKNKSLSHAAQAFWDLTEKGRKNRKELTSYDRL